MRTYDQRARGYHESNKCMDLKTTKNYDRLTNHPTDRPSDGRTDGHIGSFTSNNIRTIFEHLSCKEVLFLQFLQHPMKQFSYKFSTTIFIIYRTRRTRVEDASSTSQQHPTYQPQQQPPQPVSKVEPTKITKQQRLCWILVGAVKQRKITCLNIKL